jgi:hypothetical protein
LQLSDVANQEVKWAAILAALFKGAFSRLLFWPGDFTARRSRYHPRFHLDGRRA